MPKRKLQRNIDIEDILFEQNKIKSLKFEIRKLLTNLRHIEKKGSYFIEIDIVRDELKCYLDILGG